MPGRVTRGLLVLIGTAAILSVDACSVDPVGLSWTLAEPSAVPASGGSVGSGIAGGAGTRGTGGGGSGGVAPTSGGGGGSAPTSGNTGNGGGAVVVGGAGGATTTGGISGGGVTIAPGTGGASTGRGGGGGGGVGARLAIAGCADGTREGFTNTTTYPGIAACAGAWDVPGVLATTTLTPQCARRGGNTGAAITTGAGCSVADLCAVGWHVCQTGSEVITRAGSCNDAVASAGNNDVFYLTRQRALAALCSPANLVGTNNLHGCGNFGEAEDASCAPFPLALHQVDCSMVPPGRAATRQTRQR